MDGGIYNTVTFSNPARRRPIRGDFPEAIASAAYSDEEILAVIDAELKKHGTTLRGVARINIAYPHKHPVRRPDHDNKATDDTVSFTERLGRAAPEIRWAMADALYEERHLARSLDQSSLHALTARQKFDVDQSLQAEPLAFKSPGGKKEFFILYDHGIDQGTTLANLMNYIEHNGGAVLAAGSPYFRAHLAQKPSLYSAKAAFNNAAYYQGRIPDLALAFSRSTREPIIRSDLVNQKTGGLLHAIKGRAELTPQECADAFEAALSRHGNSLFALTDGECTRLINTVSGYWDKGPERNFGDVLGRLQAMEPMP